MTPTVIERKIENRNGLDRGGNIIETLKGRGVMIKPHSNCWNIVPTDTGVFLAAFGHHDPERMVARFGEMSLRRLEWVLDHPPENPGLIVLLLKCADHEKTSYAEVFELLDVQAQARDFPLAVGLRPETTEAVIRQMESDIHARMDELGRRPN